MGMTGAMAAMAGLSVVNGINQSNAQKNQAEFTAQQYESNQKFTQIAADSAISQGDIQAGQQAEKTKQEIGQQRVAAGATGADVNSGSAMTLQADTAWQGAQNEVTIKNNAWRTAFGYNVQGFNDKNQATLSRLGGTNAANNTLLTGGMNAVNYGSKAYSSYGNNNGGFNPGNEDSYTDDLSWTN
jgi:hypothetical protein